MPVVAGRRNFDRSTPGARCLARLNGIPVEQIPRALQLVAIPFQWDREALWRVQTLVWLMRVAQLEWHLDLPFWAHDGVPFQLTPNQVRTHPDLFPDQFLRTLAADLRYPLVVMRWRRRWTILDGVHRLLKASLMGIDAVLVQCIERSELTRLRTRRVLKRRKNAVTSRRN